MTTDVTPLDEAIRLCKTSANNFKEQEMATTQLTKWLTQLKQYWSKEKQYKTTIEQLQLKERTKYHNINFNQYTPNIPASNDYRLGYDKGYWDALYDVLDMLRIPINEGLWAERQENND